MFSTSGKIKKACVLATLSLSVTACGEKLTSGFPDAATTMYLADNSKIDFSVTGPTNSGIYYEWSLTHYDENNHQVNRESLGSGPTLQKLNFQFDADSSRYFRSEISVTLFVHNPLSGVTGHDIYDAADTMTWELSKPVAKSGTKIPGSFFARNTNDLQQLATITSIEGNLFIDDAAFGETTTLSPIASVDGDVSINHNPFRSLSELHLHPQLKIGHNLNVTNNAQLQSLSGLESIVEIADLRIENNPKLQDLVGLKNLASVDGTLAINGNKALPSLRGLESLHDINKNFEIVGNASLKKLKGVDTLYDIGGTLRVAAVDNDNPAGKFVDFSGFESVNHVGGIEIDNTLSLTTLHGLENLVTANTIALGRNAQLQNLDALTGLTTADNITLTENPLLTSIKGLENIKTLGTLFVSGNPFTRLDELTSLVSVKDLIMNWTHIDDLSMFDHIPITRRLGLYANPITRLPRMNVSKLDEIDIVERELTTLEGLENIREVGELNINFNNKLSDISSLYSLTRIDRDLKIVSNTNLCQSDAEQLLAIVKSAHGVGGQVTIESNKDCGNALPQ